MLAFLALQVHRAATAPVSTGEAYLYDRFVRPATREVLAAGLPDRDVLYSLLEKRSVGLLHVSPFSVRLPSLLFGILALFAVWRLAMRGFKTAWGGVILALAAATSWAGGWFVKADGTGAAMALLVCAVWLAWERRYLNLIGICLGLSIAAKVGFWLPALFLALAILWYWKQWWEWIDRVAIPASVVVVILLAVPASHAGAPAENPPQLAGGQTAHLRSALDALRADAGTKPIRIATVPSAEPIVNFYRAQHRANNWQRALLAGSAGHFDYYLIPSGDSVRAGELVYRDADFAVVRAAL
ncbi:MAG TPA: hypothetical protein VMB03_28920 [Bryobacteraceae bacterium]|nr:hypothetical protein [Bryobacteraceae bacterium]